MNFGHVYVFYMHKYDMHEFYIHEFHGNVCLHKAYYCHLMMNVELKFVGINEKLTGCNQL